MNRIRPRYPANVAVPPKSVPGPGGLVIVDTTLDQHDVFCREAAWQVGFLGDLSQHAVQLSDGLCHDLSRARVGSTPLNGVVYRQVLEHSVRRRAVALLETITDQLAQLRFEGLHHCAVNLSLGMTKAETTQVLLKEFFHGGQVHRQNACAALGADLEKLVSGEGDERQRFVQGMVDLVDKALQDPLVELARKNYQETVVELESSHNSVVVAAGNNGQSRQEVQALAGGPMRWPGDFCDSLLANGQTTTVGACLEQRVANYSSDYAEVDLYATGRSGAALGTSFASPRVAAVMAQMHADYPEKDSLEVEWLVADRLCQRLPDYQGRRPLPALSDLKCQEFLYRHH